jgi:hypothetical protein
VYVPFWGAASPPWISTCWLARKALQVRWASAEAGRGCWPAPVAAAHAVIVLPQMVKIAICRLLSLPQHAELICEVACIVCWGMWGVNQAVDRDVGGNASVAP